VPFGDAHNQAIATPINISESLVAVHGCTRVDALSFTHAFSKGLRNGRLEKAKAFVEAMKKIS